MMEAFWYQINMSMLYGYTNKKITKFLTDYDFITTELNEYGIELSRVMFHDIGEFTNNIIESSEFDKHQVDIINSPMLDNVPAYHPTTTAMAVLKGVGKYHFEIDNSKFELLVEAGDFIAVPPTIKQCFTTIQHMTVIKFSATDNV